MRATEKPLPITVLHSHYVCLIHSRIPTVSRKVIYEYYVKHSVKGELW